MSNSLGLYVHVPFCVQKCAYCDFYSKPAPPDVMDAYLAAVSRHIRESGRFCSGYTADTVYFGGGTPTVLGEVRLAKLLKTIRKSFNISNNAEITLEANPGTVTPKSLKKLRRSGFNRISFGVQSLDDAQLAALGRAHSFEGAKQAFDDARAAGFDNISVDLLYALPGQTVADWEKTLRGIVRWKPEHISAYALKLEPGTPMFEDKPALPDEGTQADQFLLADEILTAEGFEHYEISNFALPSRRSRHNLKYWTLEPYMGFGPSAHSDFDGKRFAIKADLNAYISGIESGGEILSESEKVPQSERAGEYLMLGLRLSRGVSSNEYARRFKVSFEKIERDLARCEEHGLAAHYGDRWYLTPKGMLVQNQILQLIINN